MKNKEKALGLLDFLVKQAEKADELHKKEAIRAGKGSKAVGESSLLFHLRTLRDLIDKED